MTTPGEETTMPPSVVLLEEYRALKAEQVARINTRDNLIYATLAAVGSVLFAVLQTNTPDLLLGVPLPTFVLGWVYLTNDEKVVQIRQYLRTVLRPHLEAEAGMPRGGAVALLGWEQPGRGGTVWRCGQLAVNVALFVAPPLGALGVWLLVGHWTPALIGAAVLGLLATTVLLAVTLTNTHRRLRGGGPSPQLPARRRESTVST